TIDQSVSELHGSAPTQPQVSPPPQRSSEERFGLLMLSIAVVIAAAQLFGALLGRLAQPRVMGEVLAGMVLGALVGFPADIVALLSGAANLGLAFYLFLVGMEVDLGALRGRAGQAAFISNVSVAFPLALGLVVALPLYGLLAPDVDYAPFALIMGVA